MACKFFARVGASKTDKTWYSYLHPGTIEEEEEEGKHEEEQGRSHVVPWGGRGPCKKKNIYPLEVVRKLIGPPYVGHLAPSYLHHSPS